jgi:hypothetical protein
MGRTEPAVCAELLLEMPPAVAAAARPVAHVTANSRRVNVARDGPEKADGIAETREPDVCSPAD